MVSVVAISAVAVKLKENQGRIFIRGDTIEVTVMASAVVELLEELVVLDELEDVVDEELDEVVELLLAA